MITLTETAATAVKSLLEREQKPQWALRLAVVGGGCAGLNYTMEITEQAEDGDHVTESHGVKLVCDPKSQPYLNGTEIDHVESVMGSGFKFSNPNAQSSCGCGTSFCA